jgi:hypothetical protein
MGIVMAILAVGKMEIYLVGLKVQIFVVAYWVASKVFSQVVLMVV